MLVGPYYISSLFLWMFSKTFNWSFFIFLFGLSAYMSYSYVSISSRKLWDEQILRD
jgi:hypothetical protein